MLLQENVQEYKKEKINQILHKSGCNLRRKNVYHVNWKNILLQVETSLEKTTFWAKCDLFFLEIFKHTFLLHTCSAEHYILYIDSSCLPSLDINNLGFEKEDFIHVIPFLGSPVSLHLITSLLPGMFYLLTAVSVCGFEEIILDLHTCLLVSNV